MCVCVCVCACVCVCVCDTNTYVLNQIQENLMMKNKNKRMKDTKKIYIKDSPCTLKIFILTDEDILFLGEVSMAKLQMYSTVRSL